MGAYGSCDVKYGKHRRQHIAFQHEGPHCIRLPLGTIQSIVGLTLVLDVVLGAAELRSTNYDRVMAPF
jgi:hypothetical protein